VIQGFASRHGLRLVSIAIVIGAVITCALVALALQNEIAHEKDVFSSQSYRIHDVVAQRLTATEEVARSLVMLFNTSDQVTTDEFRLFADETLRRRPYVRSILYLPLVRDGDRRAFERVMREERSATGSVTERHREDLIPAPRRERYFPIWFIEPDSPAAARKIGRDLLVENEAGQAIFWAVDTAGPVMSWPPEREPGAIVYTVFNAIYEGKTAPPDVAGRRRTVTGIVAVQVNASTLLDGLPAGDHTRVTLAIRSPRTDEPPVDLAAHQDARFAEPGAWTVASLQQSDDFEVAGQHVALNLRRPLSWHDLARRLVFTAAVIGLALTGLLSAIARSLASHSKILERTNREIADEVAARTHELAVEKDRALVTLESIGDGVITTDARGRVEYLNPVAERLTAYTPGDAAGRDAAEVFAIVHASTRQPADDSVIACLREARVVDVSEPVVLIGRTGAETAVDLTVTPIHDRDRRVIGTVLVFRDVTQARAMA
jgi:PAS domain S-box-containing protein